jgi:hypothetical protein
MRQVGILFPLLLALAQLPVRVSAQPASFGNAIQSSRNDIEVSDGHLLGPGAAKIRDATSHTCYVFLGEDHGIREVPEFAEALTGDLEGDGVQTLALEVSPSVARQLSLQLASPNPSQSFASFLRQFPLTVPFYNTAEEFDFLRHAKARIGTSFSLIGFDQEFLGSAKFLLQEAGEQALTNDLRKELDEFKKQEQEANSRATRSGKYEDLFLLTSDTAKLQTFADSLRSRGFDSASVDDLLASRGVYDTFAQDNHRSNEMRDLLMKRNFVRMHGTSPPCGILIKAGSNHGFRGIGPLYTRELGNFVAESADAYSNGGVHILIVGGRGQSLQFQAVGRAMKAVPYDALSDKELHPLQPFVELALQHKAWSLFDLRALRRSLESSADASLQRFLHGYDFLVVIPHPTASHEISVD